MDYTWSHGLDQGVYSTRCGQIVNSYDWRADYANSSDDIRHRFVGNFVWQIPFFHGSGNTLLRTVAAGWSLSGIATAQTGNPVKVTITQDQANTGEESQRPNLVGPIHVSSCGKVLISCINSNAFALPALYTYGDAARNPLYGPGLVDLDSSLAKTFRFHERLAFQFRMDACNTFNHVNWGLPHGVWSSPSFRQYHFDDPMRTFEFTGRLVY